jgi:hypothetical protein
LGARPAYWGQAYQLAQPDGPALIFTWGGSRFVQGWVAAFFHYSRNIFICQKHRALYIGKNTP